MPNKKYIIALDQGTTSSRALLIGLDGEIIASSQKEFTQIFPNEGWVEHDPKEIWDSQYGVFVNLMEKHNIQAEEVISLGITNQRETTVLWDKRTGEAVYNAIVWQDKRTSDYCEKLKNEGLEDYVKQETGLVIDSYFCATKVQWILDHVEGARELADQGHLCFGTIDAWLIWNFTKGTVHATDYSNASRTMFFNIKQMDWDAKLLDDLNIPSNILPQVFPSSHHYGDFEYKGASIPINGVAGDQQAALFGQACFEAGTIKNTYGTGCFLLLNCGQKYISSKAGLLTTLACNFDQKPTYVLEGSVFMAGASIQWLRDGLKIITNAEDSEQIARNADSEDEVVVVPAFAGLGAPYWDMYARGAIFGLSRKTDDATIVRATLQSIAYQTKDIVDAMVEDTGIDIDQLAVDGGACANDFLMQFQADILNANVLRPANTETTAMGAAYLAGIESNIWSLEEIKKFRKMDHSFKSNMNDETRNKLYARWQKAVKRSVNWLDK